MEQKHTEIQELGHVDGQIPSVDTDITSPLVQVQVPPVSICRKLSIGLLPQPLLPCEANNNEILQQQNSNNNTIISKASQLRQCTAVFASTIGSFGLGTVFGWSAPALDDLKLSSATVETFGELGPAESSWIASLALLGALFSCCISTFFINKFGRKFTMLITAIPFAFGWILIGFAQNLYMIYAGRFITGYAGGTFPLAVPIYVSEVCQDVLRGVLGSLMVLMMVVGMLFSFIAGTFLPWNQLSLVCGTIPVGLFIALLFTPESPRFLLINENISKAKKALIWLRGGRNVCLAEVDAEILVLKNVIKAQQSDAAGGMKSSSNTLTAVIKPWILKPMFICILLMYFQQFGGINGIMSYTVEIFRLTGVAIDANLCSIILCIIQVLTVITSIILVDKVGRKFLLISSSFVMASSLIALGIFFYLKNVVYKGEGDALLNNLPQLKWLPFISLICYVIAYSVGMGPVPWLLTMELLNPVGKGITTSIVTMTYWFLAFLSTKCFEDIGNIEIIGWHGCYWAFAINSLIGIVFIYFVIPETKGKSSLDIQKYFGANGNNNTVDDKDKLLLPGQDLGNGI